MEHIIGLLLLAGSLSVLVRLHTDARAQNWRWPSRAALYASGIALLTLSVLIALGSTQAAKIMFVGFGAVLALIVLLLGVLGLALVVVTLRDRRRAAEPDNAESAKNSE